MRTIEFTSIRSRIIGVVILSFLLSIPVFPQSKKVFDDLRLGFVYPNPKLNDQLLKFITKYALESRGIKADKDVVYNLADKIIRASGGYSAEVEIALDDKYLFIEPTSFVKLFGEFDSFKIPLIDIVSVTPKPYDHSMGAKPVYIVTKNGNFKIQCYPKHYIDFLNWGEDELIESINNKVAKAKAKRRF